MSFPIWQVARATSAGPLYFSPLERDGNKYVDGSISIVNPSWEAFNEVKTRRREDKRVALLLSIGVDNKPPSKIKVLRFAPWNANCPSASTVHGLMQRLVDEDRSFQYRRLSVEQKTSLLPAIKKNSMKTVRRSVHEYLSSPAVSESLRDCAKTLVDIRRARAETTQWEGFATGSRYRCTAQNACSKEKIQYLDRADLLDHLMREHNIPPPDIAHRREVEDLIDGGRIPLATV